MKFLRTQKGQTSIEYMLLLFVSITLGYTFLQKMGDYFSNNPNSFISRSLSNYREILGDPGRRYKTFRVPR